jgi:SAM-dependent methyltransferase
MTDWVEHPELVRFYSSHRNHPDDLYPSERHFLPGLARESASVLDVGCGAGGFATIWRSFNPQLAYTGVDASGALIDAARSLHRDATFAQADGAGPLPFADGAFEGVAALGWLHLEPRYPDALAELWRVARRWLFFDVRLLAGDEDIVGAQRLALGGEWDGRTTIPYICTSWPRLARRLQALGPARLCAHGYRGRSAATVSGVPAEVCMTTFVLERGPGPLELELDLPLGWPA